jgi:hypothetical protein
MTQSFVLAILRPFLVIFGVSEQFCDDPKVPYHQVLLYHFFESDKDPANTVLKTNEI